MIANNPRSLPPKALRQWEHVFDSARKRGFRADRAAAQAWAVIERAYYPKRGRWLVRKNPRAVAEHVDRVSRLPARPSARTEATGRWVARVRGRPTEVYERELDPQDVALQISAEALPDVRARAEAAAKREGAPTRGKRIAHTFRTPKQGAEIVVGNNWDFFSRAVESDPQDHVRDWMDSIEVGRGKRSRKLGKTQRGRELLEGFRGERRGTDSVQAVIAWILGQAPSRKWADVDWDLVRSFADALAQTLEDGGGITWYPATSGQGVGFEQLREEAPALAKQRETEAAAERLRVDLEAYRKAYKAARPMLAEDERKATASRLRRLGGLLKRPERIATTLLCEPAGADQLCEYPSIEREIARLRARAQGEATRVEERLDLPWENPSGGCVLRRAPIDLAVLKKPVVGLRNTGVIEVQTRDGRSHTWRTPVPLFYTQHTLLWFTGCGRPRPSKPGSLRGTRQARNTARAWDWQNRRERGQVLDIPAMDGEWYSLGPARSVAYRSDKAGRPHSYEHETSARFYCFAGTRGAIWALRGPRLRVTSRGIEG